MSGGGIEVVPQDGDRPIKRAIASIGPWARRISRTAITGCLKNRTRDLVASDPPNSPS